MAMHNANWLGSDDYDCFYDLPSKQQTLIPAFLGELQLPIGYILPIPSFQWAPPVTPPNEDYFPPKPQFLQASQRAQLPTGSILPIPSSLQGAPLVTPNEDYFPPTPTSTFLPLNKPQFLQTAQLPTSLQLGAPLVTETPSEDDTTSVSTSTSTPFSSPKMPLPQELQAPQQLSTNQSTVNDSDDDANVQKPGITSTLTDTGCYTCTYHDCNLHFETEGKMKKHLVTHTGMSGVHRRYKCKQINPTTRKCCTATFNRPYDLTRHERDIHDRKKQKIRCAICVEIKMFSRNDALTRHMRIVHPEVDFPGKHRNRKTTTN